MYLDASILCWIKLSDSNYPRSNYPCSNYPWLQAAVSEGGVVVTASRRLARELRANYDVQQLKSGQRAWLTPLIWSWHEWLSRQLTVPDNAADLPVVLDAASSLVLWERCLEKCLPEGAPGFGALVRQASQSWLRLEEWNVSVAELRRAAQRADERLFAAAANDYQNILAKQNWIDSGGKASIVVDLLRTARLAPPEKVAFAGFDRISPAVCAVKDALESAGTAVSLAPIPGNQSRVQSASFERTDAELRAAGVWARQLLDQNPAARIAIIVPALETNAANAAGLVREGLVPGWQYGGAVFATAANVSYGRKLADYPAIAVALLALRWANRGLHGREISILLRSRCITSDATAGRSRIEMTLRRYPDRCWLPDDFLQVFCRADDSRDAATFFGCVNTLSEMHARRAQRCGPAEWAIQLDSLLQSIDWPGPSSLDSDEFQLVNRWRELLNEFARLAVVAPEIDFATAVARLTMLANDTLYQPESGPGLVQVIGTLEAAGLEFDHLWVTGMDSSQWPPVTTPARFVSLALQRKQLMPDASPEDTLLFAQKILQRLTASAPDCVASWARAKDDLELSPASLLDKLECSPLPAIADPGWFVNHLVATQEIVEVANDTVPPVGHDERVRGGAYTVQRQYCEPFGAFVHGRLGVRTLEGIEIGLSPSVRGNIIHHALNTLLNSKPKQEELRNWSADAAKAKVVSAVDTALAEHHRYADPVLKRILGLERLRLQQLLTSFIDVESSRESFAVDSVERKLDYSRSGVTFGLRVDRIDRLADGQLLVIDYKTGAEKSFLNQHGELTDVQLVVYADALAESVGGIALLNIDSREIDFRGAGAGGPWSGKYADGWEETLQSWCAEVHAAIADLANGDARLNLLFSSAQSRPLNILSRKEALQRVG